MNMCTDEGVQKGEEALGIGLGFCRWSLKPPGGTAAPHKAKDESREYPKTKKTHDTHDSRKK